MILVMDLGAMEWPNRQPVFLVPPLETHSIPDNARYDECPDNAEYDDNREDPSVILRRDEVNLHGATWTRTAR